MKISAAIFATIFCASQSAGAAIEEDFRCLKSVNPNPIYLEFRQIGDSKVKWSAGYVLYKGSNQAIPIALSKTVAKDQPSGRPWEFESTWVEIVGGKISGTYVILHQGANIYSFTYRPTNGGKEFGFIDDNEHTGARTCMW